MATTYEQRVAEAMRKAGNAVAAGATIKGATPSMPKVSVPGGVGGVAAAATPKTTGVVPPASAVKPQATPAVSQPSQPVVPGIPNMRGGADYGTATGAQKQELVGQRQRELNDADYRQSEINRTLGVIEGLKAEGKDYSTQEKYLSKNLGYVPPMPQAQVNMPPTPAASPSPSTPYMQLTPTQINTEAAAQLARERAAMQTAANKRLADLKSGFEYSNKLLQDNRVLENAQMERNLNPFNGRTPYDKAMVNRGRGIDDSNRAAQFNAEVSAVQEDLYNFDKLSEERKTQVINELTRLERAYGIDVGQLTGNFNGQRTLAGQAFDHQRSQDQIANDAQYGGTYNGSKTAQQLQQEWENRFRYGSTIGQFNNGQKTMEAKQFEFQKAQQEWENNFRQGQFDWEKAQQTWENTFKNRSFEQDMKDAAASRGLQWASLNQREKEFLADQTWREKQFEFEKQTAANQGTTPTSYKSNPDFAQEVAYINSNENALSEIQANAQALIAAYGYDGYSELLKIASSRE